MKTKNIVFCQSLKYIVKSLNVFLENENTIIIIRELQDVYDFLLRKKLVPKENLLFLPVYKRSTINGIVNNVKVVNEFSNLLGNEIENVYLFTDEFDFMSMSIINKIKVSGNVYIESLPSRQKSKNIANVVMHNILFGVDIFVSDFGYSYRCRGKEFIIREYNDEYSGKKIKIPNYSGYSLLIVDSNDEKNPYLNNVSETYLNLISLCNGHGVDIFVKGHPRLGLSDVLQGRIDINYLDSLTPIEFLDVKDYSCVVSFYSTSLCEKSLKNKSKSLLYLSNSIKCKYYRRYLLNNGFPSDGFITKLSEIISFIK